MRQSLENACRELDLQLASLGVVLPVTSPHVNASRPLNSPQQVNPLPHAGQRLFEIPPVVASTPSKNLGTHAAENSNKVIQPMHSSELDPLLEQATLEELNSALSEAFAQIAMKRDW